MSHPSTTNSAYEDEPCDGHSYEEHMEHFDILPDKMREFLKGCVSPWCPVDVFEKWTKLVSEGHESAHVIDVIIMEMKIQELMTSSNY